MKHYKKLSEDEITKSQDRWNRQMLMSYFDLSEGEKKSDRKFALQIIENWTFDPYTGEKINP